MLFGGKNDYFRVSVVSQFRHTISYELAFDKDRHEFLPIGAIKGDFNKLKISNLKREDDGSIQRIAIQFPTAGEACYFSNTKKLRDTFYYNIFGLELEGYKVAVIDYFKWNRMAMNQASRANYIEELLREEGVDTSSLKKPQASLNYALKDKNHS